VPCFGPRSGSRMARNRRGIEEGISVQLHREAVDSTVDPAVTLPANDFAGAVGGIYALANSGGCPKAGAPLTCADAFCIT
jgi:hypothetical protein